MSDNTEVDVLIVGAGPAGLMAANWLAHLGISFKIVDKRGTKVYNGQADGLHSRTLEIFDSFDIVHRILRDGAQLSTVNSWIPDKTGTLRRLNHIRTAGNSSNDCRFRGCTLHQGHIEAILSDAVKEASGVAVERGVLPESLVIDESLVDSDDAYPITVRLRHLSELEATPQDATTILNGKSISNGLFRSNMAADDTAHVLQRSISRDAATETVSAKYLIGCDGAHSWVRDQLGFKLEGESTDYIWGVLDAKVITDFPDSRMVNTIQSAEHGNILWIPREKGLLRIYIQLSKVNTNNTHGAKFDRKSITPEVIISTGQKIMHPFKVNFTDVEWWTVYQVGQRVADHFSHLDRVFLAGDAVHTHSPKAGQGMNVSMTDTHNLGWKLSLVLRNLASRSSLLGTYTLERRRIAQDLISFDAKLSRIFSGGSAPDPEALIRSGEISSAEELGEVYAKNMSFITGMGTVYAESPITSSPSSSSSSSSSPSRGGIERPDRRMEVSPGRRLGDHPLVSQSTDATTHLHRLLPADGRFRVVLFAGDLKALAQLERFRLICAKLNAPGSFLRRFTPRNSRIDAVVEVLAVHSGVREEFADFEWPVILKPYHRAEQRGVWGKRVKIGCEEDGVEGWDYGKVWVDDHGAKTYEGYGIDGERGCGIIVRPDQYVSWVGDMDDYEGMEGLFKGFMRVQEGGEHEGAKGAPEGWAGY